MAKKKKKKEFDAALMGGYLPGARTPVMTAPVASVPPVMRDIYRWSYQTLPLTKGESLNYDIQEAGLAFMSYGAFGLMDPGNLLEAKGYQNALGVSYRRGLMFASIRGAGAIGLLLFIVDPKHRWSGGLDEPRFHQHEHIDPLKKETIAEGRAREPEVWT